MSIGPSQGLRNSLGNAGIVAAPGAHDVLSARIVAKAGFRALYCGGNAMGIVNGKGQPFVTLTETTSLVRRLSEAIAIPIIVDAGAGFGEPQHVHAAVREIESAGAAALHIDDQPFPKRAGYHRKRGSVVTANIMMRRLQAALNARINADMMVIARTDVLRTTGSLDEALQRARSYAEVGADGVIVLDLGPADAPLFCKAIAPVPLIWIGGVVAPIPLLSDLEHAGFAMALYPFNSIAAVTAALSNLWRGFASDGRIRQDTELLSWVGPETMDLVDMATYWRIEDMDFPNAR